MWVSITQETKCSVGPESLVWNHSVCSLLTHSCLWIIILNLGSTSTHEASRQKTRPARWSWQSHEREFRVDWGEALYWKPAFQEKYKGSHPSPSRDQHAKRITQQSHGKTVMPRPSRAHTHARSVTHTHARSVSLSHTHLCFKTHELMKAHCQQGKKVQTLPSSPLISSSS